MPSQYGEHLDILRYFEGRPGRFLDVGAGDGLTLSNTEPLLHVGWSGVMVEPAISQLRWLIENHGDNPKVEIIPAAIGCEAGTIEFYDARNYSSALTAHCDRIRAGEPDVRFRRRTACAITWADIPGEFSWDFINIDVEGLNLQVLQSCLWEAFQPEMVCVEIDPEEALPRMMDILAAAGLGYAKRVGGNLLAARKEIR